MEFTFTSFHSPSSCLQRPFFYTLLDTSKGSNLISRREDNLQMNVSEGSQGLLLWFLSTPLKLVALYYRLIFVCSLESSTKSTSKKVYVQYLAEWPGSFFSHRKHTVNTQCVFTSHFNIYMTTEMFKFKETFPE